MKIVHICLANFYVDGMGYQENILTKCHAKDHEVLIVTSDFAFDTSGNKTRKEKKEYQNEHGISVKVLEKSKRWPGSHYKGFLQLYETLCAAAPDVIFCHGGQFLALRDVIRYCKKHREVRLFIDQHADYYNTPVDTRRKYLGQRWIYGPWMRKAVHYTEKFWGVTPWRCEYLKDVYGIPEAKIALLPMGGDDEKIHFSKKEEIRERIRKKHDIGLADFLVVTGGKIDSAKQIDLLMEAVAQIGLEDIKLLVFGQPNEEMKPKVDALATNPHIRYIGWVSSEAVYDYFLAADLAVFPGTHSVLWEQACACGLPGVFKNWEGMRHVDVGGNAVFLERDSVEEMKDVILSLYRNPDRYSQMKQIAQEKAVRQFSYREIARRSIAF